MKAALRIVGLSFIVVLATLPSARGLSYYCGHCVVHCDGGSTDYYNISPSDCCSRGEACDGAEWYPDLCHPGTIAIAC
jgi:hypothetical protein